MVTFTNTSTGRAGLYIEPKPLPAAEFLFDKELGIRYGANTRTGKGGDVYGRDTFARIGNVHGAIYAEASAYPAARPEVELSYRWVAVVTCITKGALSSFEKGFFIDRTSTYVN